MGDREQPPPQTKPSPTKTDPTLPFFLGTGDRPGDYITPNYLRADNYDDWAGDIQLALEAHRKFGFLDGSITHADYDERDACLMDHEYNRPQSQRYIN